MNKYDISLLTDDNIGKHNHPLYSVDDHPCTQNVLNKYHFNLDQSFSSLGQLTKETLLDTWDHVDINLEDLSYVNEIEGCSDIYFVVLSKDKGDVKYKDKETEKDVICSKTSNVESEKKSSVSAVSNATDNKEKITVYSPILNF